MPRSRHIPARQCRSFRRNSKNPDDCRAHPPLRRRSPRRWRRDRMTWSMPLFPAAATIRAPLVAGVFDGVSNQRAVAEAAHRDIDEAAHRASTAATMPLASRKLSDCPLSPAMRMERMSAPGATPGRQRIVADDHRSHRRAVAVLRGRIVGQIDQIDRTDRAVERRIGSHAGIQNGDFHARCPKSSCLR